MYSSLVARSINRILSFYLDVGVDTVAPLATIGPLLNVVLLLVVLCILVYSTDRGAALLGLLICPQLFLVSCPECHARFLPPVASPRRCLVASRNTVV